MGWFGKRKEVFVVDREQWSLAEAVDRALLDWQQAQRLVDLSEGKRQVDDAIYYLRLTEKRYMYLLNHARQLNAEKNV